VGTCSRSSKTSGGKFGSLVSKCLNSHQVQKCGAAMIKVSFSYFLSLLMFLT
jgi:hypothetical protein